MKKYEVEITETIVHSAVVEANSPEEAHERAKTEFFEGTDKGVRLEIINSDLYIEEAKEYAE